ncbi:MAG: hypothetical protein WBE09_00320 [Candidatus Acidiferrales bacterium]
MDEGIRPAVRELVFGSMFLSLQFWVVALFGLGALEGLFLIWRALHEQDLLTTSILELLLMVVFVMVFGLYTFFSMFLRLRKDAQAETDQLTRATIGSWADLAMRMLAFALGSLAFGFALCLTLMHR